MGNFVLPEKWVVRAINNEEDHIIVSYINDTFKTTIEPGLTDLTTPWFYSNTQNLHHSRLLKHDGSSLNSFPNCKEITFEQFKEYVLRDKSTISKNIEEYNKILINLLTNE